jgi:hypothetical protein
MKRLFAALTIIALLAACVNGDNYLGTLGFIRRWNSFDGVKEDGKWLIDEDQLLHNKNIETEEYAVFFSGEEYMLRLICDAETDYIIACSLTVLYTNGKLTEEQKEEYYMLICMMMQVMCGIDAQKCEELLKRASMNHPEAAHYYEQDFFAYRSIEDTLGVTFQIDNMRLSSNETPELSLIPSTAAQSTLNGTASNTANGS